MQGQPFCHACAQADDDVVVCKRGMCPLPCRLVEGGVCRPCRNKACYGERRRQEGLGSSVVEKLSVSNVVDPPLTYMSGAREQVKKGI